MSSRMPLDAIKKTGSKSMYKILFHVQRMLPDYATGGIQ